MLAKALNDTETTVLLKPIYSSCVLSLDLTPGKAPVVYENGFGCNHCVVTYPGGQLAILTPRLTFEHTVFLFSVISEPPADGRRLAESLILSNFSEAEE